MAQKVNVLLIDDIDGSEATGTVVFGYKGKTYEIDLSDANAAKFEKVITPYADKARTITGSSSSSGKRGGAPARSSSGRPQQTRDLAAIRQWARENGHEVSDRGRISSEVLEKYEAANA